MPELDVRQQNPPERIPSLLSGDYLTRPEFERRYLAHPEIKKAELIDGIVYIPARVRPEHHGDPHFDITGWLGIYCAATPGLYGSSNATVRLDFFNEPQPDVTVRLAPELGGRSDVGTDGYLEGPPELVVEIAASTVSYDMNQKKDVYARHGIPEYMVLLPTEQEIVWFTLHAGRYERLQPDQAGILRSQIFPGLWRQPVAFWANDFAKVLDILQQGLASVEHAVFVAQLEQRNSLSATPD